MLTLAFDIIMKNIFIKISLFAVFLGFSGCEKGFLEEQPFSFVEGNAIYDTATGLEAAINGCYAQMNEFAGFGAGYPSLINIGSGGFWTSQGPAQDLNTLTHGGSTIWLSAQSPWDAFYAAINTANSIIEYGAKGAVDPVIKNKIVGEAHFLRGLLYFNLVRMFGGVPLHSAPVTSQNTDLPRSSKEEVYKLLIADFEKAKTTMASPGENKLGRPHKFAAAAMLGKVYLTLASDEEKSPYWQQAKDELLTVVNSKAYALQKSYARVFDINNENNAESILELQYSISGGPNNQMTNYYSPARSNYTPAAQNGPFGRNRVNKEIFDRHLTEYPTDPRIDETYIHTQFGRGNAQVKVYPANTANEGFPYIKKFIDPGFISNTTNRNFIFLRYADVLLMLAECENEINGPSKAYPYVNQVLSRARDILGDGTKLATTPANWSDLSKDVFREKIMLERRFELMGECHLYYDVRRRGTQKFLNFINEHNSYPKLNLKFDVIYPVNQRLMLFPIPDKEINANSKINPEDQNPGY
jgi:starch-binding outer membrane protein, SusD/RagB family